MCPPPCPMPGAGRIVVANAGEGSVKIATGSLPSCAQIRWQERFGQVLIADRAQEPPD